jgi:hypothetical protein
VGGRVLVEWFKVKALNSKLSTTTKKQTKKPRRFCKKFI